MESEQMKAWSTILTSFLVATGLVLSVNELDAQPVMPGFDEADITYRSEPFKISRDAIFDGLKSPGGLRAVIQGETGIEIPHRVQGLILLGGDERSNGAEAWTVEEQMATCRVVCVGRDEDKTCFNTCGLDDSQDTWQDREPSQ